METLLTFYNPRVQKCIKALIPGEPVNALQLSKRTGIGRTNIYATMDKLEKMGLAEKIPPPNPPEEYEEYGKTRRRSWRRRNGVKATQWVYMPCPGSIEAWAKRQIEEVNRVKEEALKRLKKQSSMTR